jgi:hypothetical protein
MRIKYLSCYYYQNNVINKLKNPEKEESNYDRGVRLFS